MGGIHETDTFKEAYGDRGFDGLDGGASFSIEEIKDIIEKFNSIKDSDDENLVILEDDVYGNIDLGETVRRLLYHKLHDIYILATVQFNKLHVKPAFCGFESDHYPLKTGIKYRMINEQSMRKFIESGQYEGLDRYVLNSDIYEEYKKLQNTIYRFEGTLDKFHRTGMKFRVDTSNDVNKDADEGKYRFLVFDNGIENGKARVVEVNCENLRDAEEKMENYIGKDKGIRENSTCYIILEGDRIDKFYSTNGKMDLSALEVVRKDVCTQNYNFLVYGRGREVGRGRIVELEAKNLQDAEDRIKRFIDQNEIYQSESICHLTIQGDIEEI
ncbi:hypothetical protein [Clostridium cylindrosporum]|uniref:Uncharacterized protein n=1 Tax=Clostridium cylindrosporum DSM 605 TaxID=1121307 RepID=A0A0J8DCR0_CLOCY|nr:hypothetical protein [Clostridium cylindrosporum]KMT22033.1 hypothetical protein CLCY_3c03040 [Clostridium cylindrosporum DSM 605]